MYGAVTDGQADVIVAYTSDGRIPAFDLKIVDDSKQAFPPYDAVLLVSSQAAAKPELLAALAPLVGAINLDAIQNANYRVDVEKWPARRAAEELLDRMKPARPDFVGGRR
jgi:osmoprotectant transport system permease protein